MEIAVIEGRFGKRARSGCALGAGLADGALELPLRTAQQSIFSRMARVHAALNDDRMPMMELLVAHGADVNALWHGHFPILFAPCESLRSSRGWRVYFLPLFR